MAVQNAFQRMHLSDYPPTTIMTATTTQAMLDLADLFHGLPAETKPSVETRLTGLIDCILFFAAGCASSAVVYTHASNWVFAGGPILSAITIALFVRENIKVNHGQ